VRVLKQHDLALLTVTAPPNITPLRVGTTPPGPGAKLVAWGYPVAVRGLLDTELRRRATSGTLDDLVNNSIRQQITAAGMPDPQSAVLFLEGGHLLPGHSGAPLINASDEVAGIADGGLERGAVEISWAIPADRLQDLAGSTEPIPAAGTNADVLFAADLVDATDLTSFDTGAETTDTAVPVRRAEVAPNTSSFACGNASFVKVRTRSFSELIETADDVAGLQQLVISSGNMLQPNDQYDVYQDIETGATVVTPAGLSMRSSHGFCVVDVNGTALQQVIRVATAPTPTAVQKQSVQYENDIVSVTGGSWVADPAWTYLAPFVRRDSAVVRRKGNVQMSASPAGLVPSKYAFESLSAKGGFFLGVTALRNNLSPQVMQLQQMCVMGAPDPNCAAVLNEIRLLARMNIATHLSTFPVT